MQSLENRATGQFPELSFTKEAVNRLRPDFMHHVISPLAHTAVVGSLDIIGDDFLEKLKGLDGYEVRRYAGPIETFLQDDSGYDPAKDADQALRYLGEHLVFKRHDMGGYPIWNILTDRQQETAELFALFAGQSSPDAALFNASATIPDTIETIHERHPELGLSDTKNMTAFLRNPLTPGILRGFAFGGNSFPDSLKNFNRHPATLPWREDPKKPILDMTGGQPRTSREIRNAAYQHRVLNETMPEKELEKSGVFTEAARYSSGCPVRHLAFHTDTKSLVANKLTLTSAQVELLTTGENPVVQRVDEQSYRIVRDSIGTVAHLFADALEVIAS